MSSFGVGFATGLTVGLIIGLAAGRKKPWTELTRKEQRIRLITMAGLGFLVILGIVFLFLSQ